MKLFETKSNVENFHFFLRSFVLGRETTPISFERWSQSAGGRGERNKSSAMAKYIVIASVLLVTLMKVQVLAQGLKLPPRPSVLSRMLLPTYNLWEFSRNNKDVDATLPPPKIVLSPHFNDVSNLVPQDSIHPLYFSSGPNSALRVRFLLDLIVNERGIDRRGNAETLTGQPLNFSRCSNGDESVNGIRVLRKEAFKDGTTLYILERVPFGYAEKVDLAFRDAVKRIPPITSFLEG